MNEITGTAGTGAAPRAVRWRFGDCVLDGLTLELTVRGALVSLEPKPLDMLMFLLRHPGEVVTKDELLENLWSGRILSESVLTKCVAKLRQGLGDEDQAIIKTVHGFGYRLMAPVTLELPESAARPLLAELKAGDSPPLRPHWQLKERLGSGGYGDVWLAEHQKTRERRVFKFGRDAPSLTALKREITLFRLLKDTLGPERRDFVKLLDWNLEEPPYFIESEYATGGSLPQWAEAQGGLPQVPLAQRLALIAQVADTLAAAHSAGVLHKDLKPSNILMDFDEDRQPRTRLGDFGSGRVMDLARLEHLEITRMGFTQTAAADGDTASGTPFYFAPELLAGQQPTVQSDIYALGVILYQAAVGDFTRPLAPGWEQDIADELLREDIAAAAAGHAANRLADAGELARRLRALDARRLERAAQRKAEAESAELRQALERARVRRGWALATAGVFALALVVAGLLLVQVQAARNAAQAASDRATAAAATEAAVNEFLVKDLLAQANPFESGKRDVPIRELLGAAARNVSQRFAGKPAIEGAVRLALGESYTGLAEFAAAERELLAVVAMGGAQAQAARLQLGGLYTQTDRLAEAAQVLQPLLAAQDPQTRVRAQFLAAWVEHQQGRHETALAKLDALRPAMVQQFGADSPIVADFLQHRANALTLLGRYDEAAAGQREALATKRRIYGDRHVQTIEAMRGLGGTLYWAEKPDEALPLLQQAYEIASDVLGDEHDKTLLAMVDLATTQQARKAYAEAESLFQRAVALRLKLYGEEHKETRTAMNNFATLYGEMERHDLELPLLQRVYELELRASGADNPDTLLSAHNLGRSLAQLRRYARAEPLQRQTLARARAVFPEGHLYLAIMQYTWADSLAHLNRYGEAAPQFEQAIAALSASAGPDSQWTQKATRYRDEMRQRQAQKGKGGT